jgi:SprT-like protein
LNAFNKIKRNDRETTNNTQNIDVMTQNELQVLVMQISKKYFGLPFKHIARFNTRLKTTGGRYLLASHDLEFNFKMANLPEFEGIVKHEQRGYQHKDLDFKKLLAQVGGSRFAPSLKQGQTTRYFWLYCCENGHNIPRKRRFQEKNYRCGQCGEKIRFVGQTSNK